MDKGENDQANVLTTSYVAAGKSGRSNMNNMKDKILLWDYGDSKGEVRGKEREKKSV